jgi:hypothetical protein
MNVETILRCRAKADRAEAAIEEMTAEWTAWLDTNPYTPRIEGDRDLGEYRLFYDFSTPIPPRFGVRIGEIAHHLRSALDHLVWCETTELLGHEPSRKEPGGNVTFPICRTRAEFKNARAKRFIRPDAWAVIERHQPYRRGKQKRSAALALLHWINRTDKHRLLHGGRVSLGSFNPLWLIHWEPSAHVVAAPRREELIGRKLTRETEVASYSSDPNGPEANVTVRRTPPLTVAFGNAPGDLGAVEISETVRHVRLVVNDFATLVPSAGHRAPPTGLP